MLICLTIASTNRNIKRLKNIKDNNNKLVKLQVLLVNGNFNSF